MCNNCNPCDNCAPKCQECCNPNIQWDWCVTVDQSEEGVITISAPCPTEVTSDDWTIGVTEKEPHEWYSKRFDLTVQKPDKKVWACDSDSNPWSLYDKLVEGHWIDLQLENCPWDARIRVEVDESQLNIPNNKVALSWCSGNPDYLDHILTSSSSVVWLERDSNCHYVIVDKLWYQAWKMVLSTSVTKWMEWNTIGKYILADTSWPSRWDYQIIQASFRQDNTVTNWMEVLAWWLIAHKRWIYLVSFQSNFECDFWIHWMRVWLVLAHDATYTPLLESRFSWPVWLKPSDCDGWIVTSPEDYAREFNWMYIARTTEKQWVIAWWSSASLWWVLDRMPNGWFTLVRMEEWDWLFITTRVQSSTSYYGDYLNWWEWKNWHFTVLWADSAWNTWDDVWTQVAAYMLVAL